jgi:hypothetical protein
MLGHRITLPADGLFHADRTPVHLGPAPSFPGTDL